MSCYNSSKSFSYSVFSFSYWTHSKIPWNDPPRLLCTCQNVLISFLFPSLFLGMILLPIHRLSFSPSEEGVRWNNRAGSWKLNANIPIEGPDLPLHHKKEILLSLHWDQKEQEVEALKHLWVLTYLTWGKTSDCRTCSGSAVSHDAWKGYDKSRGLSDSLNLYPLLLTHTPVHGKILLPLPVNSSRVTNSSCFTLHLVWGSSHPPPCPPRLYPQASITSCPPTSSPGSDLSDDAFPGLPGQ